jgi:hypothetical protein
MNNNTPYDKGAAATHTLSNIPPEESKTPHPACKPSVLPYLRPLSQSDKAPNSISPHQTSLD